MSVGVRPPVRDGFMTGADPHVEVGIEGEDPILDLLVNPLLGARPLASTLRRRLRFGVYFVQPRLNAAKYNVQSVHNSVLFRTYASYVVPNNLYL